MNSTNNPRLSPHKPPDQCAIQVTSSLQLRETLSTRTSPSMLVVHKGWLILCISLTELWGCLGILLNVASGVSVEFPTEAGILME